MLESRTPRSQSSARQIGSQPPALRRISVRTKTVLPPSGMNPFSACRCSRLWNQKKYSRQFRRLYQLDGALDDIGTLGPEGVVDMREQLGMHLVLGVENADDVAPAVRQGGVERLRLGLHLVGVGDHPDPVRCTRGELNSGPGGFRIIVSDDNDDLVFGVRRFE